MFFDSHAHLDDSRFDEDRDEIIKGMKEKGVSNILNCGSDIESSIASVALAQKYDFIVAAVGVHPHSAKELENLDEVLKLAENAEAVAIGEIGLDYHYDYSPRDVQKKWFEAQLSLANELKKPVIIHEREAYADCLDILKAHKPAKCVMHCFSGSKESAKEVFNIGIYVSFAGPLTFKNNIKTVEVAKYAPLDMILIETDSPYLSPVPHRGERNDSSYVRHVAEKLAEIRGMSVEEIAKITADNAKRLFGVM